MLHSSGSFIPPLPYLGTSLKQSLLENYVFENQKAWTGLWSPSEFLENAAFSDSKFSSPPFSITKKQNVWAIFFFKMEKEKYICPNKNNIKINITINYPVTYNLTKVIDKNTI